MAQENVRSNFDVSKDSVWDAIEITIEEVYNPEAVLKDQIEEVTELITELKSDIKESLNFKKSDKEWTLKYNSLKNDCQVLESMLKLEK
jgi:predicted DNA-binding protein YlxM (UPF0122 family)